MTPPRRPHFFCLFSALQARLGGRSSPLCPSLPPRRYGLRRFRPSQECRTVPARPHSLLAPTPHNCGAFRTKAATSRCSCSCCWWRSRRGRVVRPNAESHGRLRNAGKGAGSSIGDHYRSVQAEGGPSFGRHCCASTEPARQLPSWACSHGHRSRRNCGNDGFLLFSRCATLSG